MRWFKRRTPRSILLILALGAYLVHRFQTNGVQPWPFVGLLIAAVVIVLWPKDIKGWLRRARKPSTPTMVHEVSSFACGYGKCAHCGYSINGVPLSPRADEDPQTYRVICPECGRENGLGIPEARPSLAVSRIEIYVGVGFLVAVIAVLFHTIITEFESGGVLAFLLALFLVLMAMLACGAHVLNLRRWRNRRGEPDAPPRCAKCGYDMTDIPRSHSRFYGILLWRSRCPECGHAPLW